MPRAFLLKKYRKECFYQRNRVSTTHEPTNVESKDQLCKYSARSYDANRPAHFSIKNDSALHLDFEELFINNRPDSEFSIIDNEQKKYIHEKKEKEILEIGKTVESHYLVNIPKVKGPLPQSSFNCKLCWQVYTDALSLAEHKCSGIKHVEHRCPECSKVFSCPANLASHRRWHRPRSPSTNRPRKMNKQYAPNSSKSSIKDIGAKNSLKYSSVWNKLSNVESIFKPYNKKLHPAQNTVNPDSAYHHHNSMKNSPKISNHQRTHKMDKNVELVSDEHKGYMDSKCKKLNCKECGENISLLLYLHEQK